MIATKKDEWKTLSEVSHGEKDDLHKALANLDKLGVVVFKSVTGINPECANRSQARIGLCAAKVYTVGTIVLSFLLGGAALLFGLAAAAAPLFVICLALWFFFFR